MTTDTSRVLPRNGCRFTVENGSRFLESLYFGTSSSFASVAMTIIVVNTVRMKTVNAEFQSDASSRRQPSTTTGLETA
jgi:hypothetical protein